jgi:hypothetical protein
VTPKKRSSPKSGVFRGNGEIPQGPRPYEGKRAEMTDAEVVKRLRANAKKNISKKK